MKKISIFGLGTTTKAIVKFLNQKGVSCNIFDDNFKEEGIDENNNHLFFSKNFNPQNSDLEITSPGIPPNHMLIQKANHLISEYDYFYNQFDSSYTPETIWISGTNGKTTTTEMLSLLLGKIGAKSGGNIGNPLANLFIQKIPLWILETSSFSIHYTHKAYPKLYLLLPVRPDHITWHNGFEEYINTKLKPLKNMTSSSYALIPKEFEDKNEVQNYKGNLFLYEKSSDIASTLNISFDSIKFKEPFLLDSLLALYASKIFTNEINIDLLNTFNIGKHRIEEFFDKNNNLWVDDSKGTNVDATLEALKRYKNKKIYLILGGDDKGANQNPIFDLIQKWDIEIFCIGSNEIKLLELSKQYGIVAHSCKTLKKAVDKIKSNFNQNAVALLSPAAASLDQFSSYKQRGELFKQYALTN